MQNGGRPKNFKSTVLQLHEGLIFILALKKGTVSPQLLPGVEDQSCRLLNGLLFFEHL